MMIKPYKRSIPRVLGPPESWSFEQAAYDIILADPPWTFRHEGEKGAAEHYDTMDLKSIKRLPVQDLAAKNSALFIWGCWSLLPECLDVIKAWGFTYRTNGFVWFKLNKKRLNMKMGLGSYTRQDTEFCLLAFNGKSKGPKVVNHSVRATIFAPTARHSEKPRITHHNIETLYGPAQRRVELFSRQPRQGWDCWGNDPSIEAIKGLS